MQRKNSKQDVINVYSFQKKSQICIPRVSNISFHMRCSSCFKQNRRIKYLNSIGENSKQPNLLYKHRKYQSVSGTNKCKCNDSLVPRGGRVQSCAIQNFMPRMVGTSFMLVTLTRLNVSEPKH